MLHVCFLFPTNTVHTVFTALVPCINHCKLRKFHDRKNTECLDARRLIFVGSLPFNIKQLGESDVVIWRYIIKQNLIELNFNL